MNLLEKAITNYPAIIPLLKGRALALAVKTFGYFLQALNQRVVDLYRGDITEGAFVDELAALLDQQLQRAWNEGMRANDLDPLTETLPEWEQALQEIIAEQYMYVDTYASDIAAGREAGTSLASLQSRAAMWANRYNDVVAQATLITADGKTKLTWRLGATEKHCTTCGALNGITAFAVEWEALGIRPQNAPNSMLECGGWQCDCSLEPTDKRRSPDAYGSIMNIVTTL